MLFACGIGKLSSMSVGRCENVLISSLPDNAELGKKQKNKKTKLNLYGTSYLKRHNQNSSQRLIKLNSLPRPDLHAHKKLLHPGVLLALRNNQSLS